MLINTFLLMPDARARLLPDGVTTRAGAPGPRLRGSAGRSPLARDPYLLGVAMLAVVGVDQCLGSAALPQHPPVGPRPRRRLVLLSVLRSLHSLLVARARRRRPLPASSTLAAIASHRRPSAVSISAAEGSRTESLRRGRTATALRPELPVGRRSRKRVRRDRRRAVAAHDARVLHQVERGLPADRRHRRATDQARCRCCLWEPWAGRRSAPTSRSTRCARSSTGAHDPYITRFARASAYSSGPSRMRFAHEMNGAWFPWSEQPLRQQPGRVRARLAHVHNVFEQVGRHQRHLGVEPEHHPPGAQCQLAPALPRRPYVDWVGMVGYAVRENERARGVRPTINRTPQVHQASPC